MGKKDYLVSREKQVELLVLIIYTVYSVFVIYCSYQREWNPYVQIMVLGILIYPWILYIGKYLSYRHRAYTTAIMCMICLLVYDMHMENLLDLLTTFIALTILVGLYGIPKIISLMAWNYSFLLVYYIFIRKGMFFDSDIVNTMRTLLLIITVYVSIFVTYYMVKRNEENKNSMLEMIEALQHSEHVKDDFLANVSHEIRTPINTICGISEIMLGHDVPEELHEDLINIQNAGKNLMSVVTDILDFSELQNDDFELIEETYYVSSTIYDIINMALAKKGDKKLQFIVDCDATIPSVLIGDEQKIRRVIMNIVDNAIKFTNEGCVRLGIGYRKEDYGINLIISVKDTGIGMSEENIELVFEEFTQMDMSRTRDKGGVGLGLAISKAIISKMGGFFTAKSQLGKGSEVQFVIPQKVYDYKPMAEVENKESINAAVYINMEQFSLSAIRDEYTNSIMHMMNQLDVKCHICRNLAELKRREKQEEFSHYFISLLEYLEDPQYFDILAKRNNVSIIIDNYDDMKVRNRELNRVYKPFFVLSIVSVLNTQKEEKGRLIVETESHTMDASNVHVLIVDDNKMNIRVLEGLLTEYKLKTSHALSGAEALKMLETKEYDLVFMDHMMPEMDGVECFHHIRNKKDEYYQNIPIIALTANAVAGAREMFMKEGFNDYVAKPVESSVLYRTLKRHISFDKDIEDNFAEKEKSALAKVVHDLEVKETSIEQPASEPSKLNELSECFEIEKGLLYCGNENNYIQILSSHRESGRANMAEIQELFNTQNWKNYTIAIHGVKSSMMSIGAVQLSEQAKALEMAGKSDDIAYIEANHMSMMAEYDAVLSVLEKSSLFGEIDTPTTILEKEEIREEDFAALLTQLEDGAYSLDSDGMVQILEKLHNVSYKGEDLDATIKIVMKKVAMSDFISAYETVVKFKEKLDKA